MTVLAILAVFALLGGLAKGGASRDTAVGAILLGIVGLVGFLLFA